MSAEVATRGGIPPFDALSPDRSLRGDLRSDHAGETGAMAIYRGMLQLTGDAELIHFARSHLATEERHLELLDSWLPADCKSRLLPLWRLSGWCLGAFAALLGQRFAYRTIDAVEQFVVDHYQAQIDRTSGALRQLLLELQAEERAHRDDARHRAGAAGPGIATRLWQRIVGGGSAAAVHLARRI